MWLRATLLVAIAVWSFYIGFRHEKRVLARLARAARGSVPRAIGVITAYFLALVAVLAMFGLLASITHSAGWPTVTIIILFIGLTLTAPFLWILAPAEAHGPTSSATSFLDLRRRGAKKGVARAIAYLAVAYHFLLLFPAIAGTAMAIIMIV